MIDLGRSTHMVVAARAAYGAVSSLCDRWGHCKTHAQCCYCLEAARVWAEMIQLAGETYRP